MRSKLGIYDNSKYRKSNVDILDLFLQMNNLSRKALAKKCNIPLHRMELLSPELPSSLKYTEWREIADKLGIMLSFFKINRSRYGGTYIIEDFKSSNQSRRLAKYVVDNWEIPVIPIIDVNHERGYDAGAVVFSMPLATQVGDSLHCYWKISDYIKAINNPELSLELSLCDWSGGTSYELHIENKATLKKDNFIDRTKK